jgi:FtsP/CotA-like multicopper oxidase with cupredoxin domain
VHLPGWSGDDLVREVTPPGKTPTFNGTNTYLPEIEIAVQDRMYNVDGGLYWPVAPTNPAQHPYWTPEFFGDIFTVNGKTWPYLSVAPRKYAFRFLDGCNARFLNMWLTSDPTLGVLSPKDGPAITRISTEGGFLEAPVVLDPTLGQTLFLAPAERPTIIIDFTGYTPGTVFTLMNDAIAPYPSGDPIIPGLTDRIMQFVVNGEMVSAIPPAAPADKSVVPADLRPLDPMVKLTNFDNTTNIAPVKTRQLLLNEVLTADGPLQVLINNNRFKSEAPDLYFPAQVGDPTEIPTEGTTEVWQIINTTADAHPIHPHLVQWQLVSRQPFNSDAYLLAYAAAWATRGLPNFPSFNPYPGGSGTPFPYDSVNTDGAIGGNPSVSSFYTGPAIVIPPEERGWKDSFKAFAGEVSTYICRVAPTDKPINAPVDQLVYSFDPSTGPGYVWH